MRWTRHLSIDLPLRGDVLDGDLGALGQRLREYQDKTRPLVDYYSKAGVLRSVDGVGDLEVVLGRITQALA